MEELILRKLVELWADQHHLVVEDVQITKKEERK